MPELILLVMIALMPFGGWAVMLLISWILHIVLRIRDGGQSSSGRRAQVIVTAVSWLGILVLSVVLNAFIGNTSDAIRAELGLTGILNNLVVLMTLGMAYVPIILPMGLLSGIFFAAQLTFWVSALMRLWERKRIGAQAK